VRARGEREERKGKEREGKGKGGKGRGGEEREGEEGEKETRGGWKKRQHHSSLSSQGHLDSLTMSSESYCFLRLSPNTITLGGRTLVLVWSIHSFIP
jgi:hypothetical protein